MYSWLPTGLPPFHTLSYILQISPYCIAGITHLLPVDPLFFSFSSQPLTVESFLHIPGSRCPSPILSTHLQPGFLPHLSSETALVNVISVSKSFQQHLAADTFLLPGLCDVTFSWFPSLFTGSPFVSFASSSSFTNL